jgi:hypothetical protein
MEAWREELAYFQRFCASERGLPRRRARLTSVTFRRVWITCRVRESSRSSSTRKRKKHLSAAVVRAWLDTAGRLLLLGEKGAQVRHFDPGKVHGRLPRRSGRRARRDGSAAPRRGRSGSAGKRLTSQPERHLIG